MKREYRDYVADILDALASSVEFNEGMTFDEFKADKKTVFAVTRAIEIIGEAAESIPPDLRSEYPDIPWRDMAGMRDKLVHEYFGVDVAILWETLQEDVPSLLPLMEKMAEDLK